MAFHGDHCSSKAKNYVSGKDKTVTGSNIVERGYSKLSAGAVPQRTETKSKGGFDEKSSQRSQSKLNKPRVDPSLVSAKVKEPRQDVQKRNYRTENPPRTGNHSSTLKASEPTSSVSVEKKELKTKRSLYKDDANMSSASILKKSSTSAKHSASESSSKVNFTSVSHGKVQSSSLPKQINPGTLSGPSSFKIPKKVQSEPLESKFPTNPHFRRAIKRPVSGVLTNTFF